MIEVHGIEKLVGDFTKAGLMAAARAHDVVKDGGEKVARYAKEAAPKRRPQLAPSITSEMIDLLTAEIGPENALGGGYGHIVEKGLAGRPPQPFLSPSLDRVEPDLMGDFDKMVEKLL